MNRLLVVPAAGRGTRLGASRPKLLVPVAGRPMIDWIVERHRRHVDGLVLVVAPEALETVRRHAATLPIPAECALQEQPTGMLDAVLAAREVVARHATPHVWITWCDQVGLRAETLAELARLEEESPRPDAIFPTVWASPPYIHFDRDGAGTLTAVRHRREGDAMPAQGEGDVGLFSLSREAFLGTLAEFRREGETGASTGERNFLPFLPWLARRGGRVRTFPARDAREALGINTPEDLARVQAWLEAQS